MFALTCESLRTLSKKLESRKVLGIFQFSKKQVKAEIQGFQSVQNSWKTDSCSESYGPIEIVDFSTAGIFGKGDFRSVELIWYDFLRYGTIFVIMVRFS